MAAPRFPKKLVLIGAGYFLKENPSLQALSQSSKVDGIQIQVGAAGSVLMGLDFQGNGINVFAPDIVIKRNRFANYGNNTPDWSVGTINLYYNSDNSSIPVSNVIISQNYGLKIALNYPNTGILVTNNYVATSGYLGDQTTDVSVSMHPNAVAIFQNNIFRRGRVVINNSSVTNNIMYAGTFEGSGNLVSNNLGNGTQFGTANGNKSDIDMATVFVGSGTSPNGQWKLKAGSPAIGAGYGHTAANPVDAGMYSGYTPYVVAGLPPIPAIYYFENKPVGSDTDPISVTIKVRSVGN